MQNNEIVDWLLIHYGQEQMRPGLTRMKEALGDLFPAFHKTKIVTIAGTNGKGETTLHLSHLLKEHSHCAWTSPHIERITERFRDERGEIPLEELGKLIQECHEEVLKKKYQLSFYEFLFFVFCTWATKKSPEFLLLEVGLGGRLDAVNVFDARLVLLPSISRDHQEILGHRYDQILHEKLGVLRPQSTLISFLETHYLREKAHAFSNAIGATFLDLNLVSKLRAHEFSLRNSLLASAAFCHLTGEKFDPSSEKLPLPLANRGEVLKGKNEWHFFGSHNVDGMRKLIQFLHSDNYTFPRPSFDSCVVAFSNRPEKDLRVMLRMLKASGFGKIFVTVFPHPKAQNAQVMKRLSEEEGLEFVQDMESNVQGWNNCRILVTGSYYFLGHFKSLYCR